MTNIDDVIDHIEDALNAAEALRERGSDGDDGKAAAIDAINQIRRGEYTEAITTLEREFLPKWSSRAECEAAYRKATGVDNTTREVGREIERAMA